MSTDEGIAMTVPRHISAVPDHVGLSNASSEMSAAVSIARQRYCIIALCNDDHGADVEGLIRRELRSPAISVDRIGTDRKACRGRVRVVAVVTCSAPARAHLFRLVNRLGLDAGVRSIRWETASSARHGAAGQQLDASPPRAHPATTLTAEHVAGARQ